MLQNNKLTPALLQNTKLTPALLQTTEFHPVRASEHAIYSRPSFRTPRHSSQHVKQLRPCLRTPNTTSQARPTPSKDPAVLQPLIGLSCNPRHVLFTKDPAKDIPAIAHPKGRLQMNQEEPTSSLPRQRQLKLSRAVMLRVPSYREPV